MSKIIYKGQEYISGSQYQELTQTEYNALSEAEKKNGTLYFVTDGVPGDGQDYVIEQGTSDIWTYRKWASGIAECWGTRDTSWSVNFTQKVTGVYSADGWVNRAENLPSGLFTSVNSANASIQTSGYTTIQVAQATTSAITLRVWNSYTTSGMSIYSYSMHVIGSWN